MSYRILTDSCFWLGLLDNQDQYHDDAIAVADLIVNQQLVLPWCCLSEIISTRQTRHRQRIIRLESLLLHLGVILFDDSEYRQDALQEVFDSNNLGFTYSFTDSVIREVLKDVDVNINYLVTFNDRDFEDVCQLRRIEILNR